MKKIFLNILLFTFWSSLSAQIDRSIPIASDPPQINFEEPVSIDLKNGLKVMIVENHKLPRVSINLLIDNPPIFEGELSGISNLTGMLIGKGNTKQNKDSFNEEVDFMGARMSFSSQGGFASSLSRYYERVLTMFSQSTLNPEFLEEEFNQQKNILFDNIKNNEKNTPSIARRVENAIAYSVSHPYGEFISNESLENVKLADIKNFYEIYFKPNNAYLVIIGDVKVEETKKLVKKLFRKWKNDSKLDSKFSEKSNNNIITPKTPDQLGINIIDMPNSANSEITFQNLIDLKMSNKDYFSALIANRILGAGAESRLFNNIREDKGYAYGAYSGLGDDKYSKAKFRATTTTRSQVTDSALIEILKEIEKIQNYPVSEKELKNAKAKYLGEFVLAMERTSTIANYAINIESNELESDYYKTFLSNINKVTVEDVQKAANKYFALDNAQLVVTGKGSEIIEKLENIQFNGKKIPVNYYDKTGSVTSKPEYSSKPIGLTAKNILENYINAIGGNEKLSPINSLILSYEGQAMGSKIISEENRVKGKFANRMTMNGNEMMKMVITESRAFAKQGPNKMELPTNMHTDLKKSLGIFPELNLLNNPNIKFIGIEKVGEVEAYVIEISGDVISSKFLYDVKTGLKIKEISTTNIGGQSQIQESEIGKYKEYEGILFPTIKTQSFGPQSIEMILNKVILNSEFNDEVFN